MAPGKFFLYKLNTYILLLFIAPSERFDKGFDNHLLSWYLLIFLAFERLSDCKHEYASGIFAEYYIFFVLAFRAQISELEFNFFNHRFEYS